MLWNRINNSWKAASNKIKFTWGKLRSNHPTKLADKLDLPGAIFKRRYAYAKLVLRNDGGDHSTRGQDQERL